MAPIRTAIIGLSSTAVTGWASSAHLPYLLSARGKAKYQIVALCNSSVDAARAAIAVYNLPPETRAYGSPEDLARDPDVDLVVCNTRVDKHYETVRPSIEAGKAVFVEWPLAHGIEQVRELTSLAKQKGGRSMIGLQGRFAPPVQKLREIVESGRIGKVLSSEVKGAGGTNDREVMPEKLKYFTQRDIGGNVFTIGLGHLWEYVQAVVGEAQDVHGHLQLQRPDVKIRDLKTNTITGATTSDVPDLIIATASLKGTDHVQEGASLLVRFRRGQPFPGEAPLIWTINGEKGEIRLTAPGGTTLHAFAYSDPVTIEIHDFETDSVETVQWQWEQWREELPIPARSVAALYEAFAEGDETKYPTFEHALRRHEQLEGILSRWPSKE